MSRVAVYAPTPAGGHPEYVAALVGAMAERESARFVWPVRPDAEPQPVAAAVDRPVALPVMPQREQLSRLRWVRARLRPSVRHDLAFLGWLRRRRRDVDWVLLEEYEQLTLPLLVWGARLLGLPVAVHVHNVTPHGYRGTFGQRLAARVARLGAAGARLVVVHTHRNAEAARRLLRPRGQLAVVGHGVRPRRAENPPTAGAPHFLFFGAYRANKGLDVLVEALRELPGARLTVAGPVPDDDVPAVARLLAPLGDRITWHQRLVPDAELTDLFDGVTAVVLPYRQFEAQSGVLHLAVEMAVPVVVSDVGGLAETTSALGIGLVVAPEDPAALAAALRRVAEPGCNAVLRRAVTAAQGQLSWQESARRWWAALDEAARS